jgi:hypothetical protein
LEGQVGSGETWTLTKETENLLTAFESKALRRFICPIKDKGHWRKRYDKELYEICKEPEISIVIKLKGLQWAGHLQTLDEQNIPKKVFTEQLFGKGPVW